MLKEWIHYLRSGIWQVSVDKLPRREARRITWVRVVVLAARRVKLSGAPYRASVLTMYTLLSLAPALAVGVGIAKGFGYEEMFRRQVYAAIPGDPHVAETLVGYANTALRQARSDVMAGAGLAALLAALIRLLTHVEHTLNAIFDVPRPKPLRRRLADHTALVFLTPIAMLLAGGATVMLDTTLRGTIEGNAALSPLLAALSPGLRLVSLALVCGAISLAYIHLPNTHVRLGSALIAGGVAGVLYQIAQWLFVYSQTSIGRAGALYGGFSFVPLMIAWVQTSWLIVLFGAGLAYAHQHGREYEYEEAIGRSSLAFRRRVALLAAVHLARRFAKGETPVEAETLAAAMGAPLPLARAAAHALACAGIVAMLDAGSALRVVPARPMDTLTIADVWRALDGAGGDGAPLEATPEWDAVERSVAEIERGLGACGPDVTLGDLAAGRVP